MTVFKNFAFAAALIAAPFAGAQAQYFSPASTPNSNSTPFWDVVSDDDGAGCNLGYVLSGNLTVCKNNKLTGAYSAPFNSSFTGAWFAHASGDVDSSVGFKFFAGAGASLQYFGGIAGASPLASLAIRDLGTNSILHVFTTSATSYTFNGPGYFDIGIAAFLPASATPNFFSWTNVTPNQFAVFGNGAYAGQSGDCGTSGCWIGAEDKASLNSDYDYNDGVLRVSGARVIVPEPSQSVLLVGSMLALVGVARRRKQA